MTSGRLVTSALMLAILCVESAYGQFHELTKRIPDEANAVVFVDVEKLQNSPLGKREDWRGKQERSFEAGLDAIPPTANEFVAAAKLDLVSKHPTWQVGIANLRYDPSVPEIAIRYQGTTDYIDERPVAILPGDMYVVKFMENIVGYGWPARRQDAAQWITRYYDNSLRGLSEYLSEAQEFADNGSPIIMAIDLGHSVSPEMVKQRLPHLETLKDREIDLEKWSKGLASIRGVSLGVTVKDEMVGAVKVDFAEDISFLGPLAKPILLEVLAHNGMMIDELETWEVVLTKNRIQLSGPLYNSGLRRILSLVEPPPELQHAIHDSKENGDEEKSEKELTIAASQIYFKSIVSLLDDLRMKKKDRKTLGQLSVWFDKYARKIDRLPIANVDHELLNYGENVSHAMRGGQAKVIDAAVAKTIRQQNVPEQYDTYSYSVPIGANWTGSYGWNGWYSTPNWERTLNEKAKVRREENIRGGNAANDVMRNLENATFQMRRHLTEKYGVEF